MASMTQYWINAKADWEWRGQVLIPPATWYVGLFVVIPTQSTGGTELTTGAGFTGYARQPLACSLAAVSGTQSDGSTSPSSGTRNYVSNNAALTFSTALTAAWNGIVAAGLFDALTGGNLCRYAPIVDGDDNQITISRASGESFIVPATYLRLIQR